MTGLTDTYLTSDCCDAVPSMANESVCSDCREHAGFDANETQDMYVNSLIANERDYSPFAWSEVPSAFVGVCLIVIGLAAFAVIAGGLN